MGKLQVWQRKSRWREQSQRKNSQDCEPKSTNITVKFHFQNYYNEFSIDSAFSAPTLPDKRPLQRIKVHRVDSQLPLYTTG